MVTVRILSRATETPTISCRVSSAIKLSDLRAIVNGKIREPPIGNWYWRRGPDDKEGANEFVEIVDDSDTLDSLGEGKVTDIYIERELSTGRAGSSSEFAQTLGSKRDRQDSETNILSGDDESNHSSTSSTELPGFRWRKLFLEAEGQLSAAEERLVEAERLHEETKAAFAAAQKQLIATIPAVALMEHSDEPLMALWIVLNDKRLEDPSAAMSVINDPRCGLRATQKYGFENNFNFNDEQLMCQPYPLTLAIHANRFDVVKAIIKVAQSTGALSALLNEGLIHQACFAAAQNGYIDMLAYLLRLNIDINKWDFDSTPLITAAVCGHADCVSFLIKAGINLNKQHAKSGCTALHCAAAEKHEEVIRILLDNKADTRIKCKNGHTAFYYAHEKGAEASLLALLR